MQISVSQGHPTFSATIKTHLPLGALNLSVFRGIEDEKDLENPHFLASLYL